ncbi:MAG: anti-sigma factor family protein [Fimbriimonadales bacterium]
MNCRYVQSRLSAYLDCELSGVEHQQIRSHLEQCIECSRDLETLRLIKQMLRQMPSVVPRYGPERVLLLVRQSAPAPRRAPLIRWRATRWWQYAGGFALAAAIAIWGASDDTTTTPTTPPETLSSTTVITNSPILNPLPSHEMFSAYRPSALFSVRKSPYYSTPPPHSSLMPSLAQPSDPLMGYQPVSEWSSIPVEPKIVESWR